MWGTGRTVGVSAFHAAFHAAFVGAFVGAFGLTAPGCADSPSSSGSSAIWCDGLCAAQRRCGDTRAPSTCEGDCVGHRRGLTNLSETGAASEQPCLAMLTCDAIFGNQAAWEAELDACWQQAKLSVEISPHVRSFCVGYTEAWFECGSSYSTDGCEHDYAMWADHVLDNVAACESQPTCTGLDACLTTLFENL